MIHYHGGPIWPESAAAKIWKNRHAFISFARSEQIGVASEVASTFALDNGAFALWRSGKKTDWDGYYDFVDKWRRHPGFDWALIPDVIDGDEWQNAELMDQWPFPNMVGVPVWHLHESIHWLISLCEKYPRVAIGSSGEYHKVGSQKWWGRMATAMDEVTDDYGRPFCKLHGLRMLDPAIFAEFPFSSCDSTNVAQNCRDSKRWTVYNPPNNETRGLVLAERIESINSAATWSNVLWDLGLRGKNGGGHDQTAKVRNVLR